MTFSGPLINQSACVIMPFLFAYLLIFLKFYKNGENRKLKACTFRLNVSERSKFDYLFLYTLATYTICMVFELN